MHGRRPHAASNCKTTINNHYNGTFLEPWGERSQRGYGIEVIERFVREVATRRVRRPAVRASASVSPRRGSSAYNDLAADRQVVAAVQAMEAILDHAYRGQPDCVARYDAKRGVLTLHVPEAVQ